MSTPDPRSAKFPGINMFDADKSIDLAQVEQAMRLEAKLRHGTNRWNVHQRLVKYAEVADQLARIVTQLMELNQSLHDVNHQLLGSEGERARKRWTGDEDELLVEQACADGTTLMQLALTFNRSPAAVSSRLTYLVGVSRLNRAVAGRLIGYLDGEPVDGFFHGRFNKLESA